MITLHVTVENTDTLKVVMMGDVLESVKSIKLIDVN